MQILCITKNIQESISAHVLEKIYFFPYAEHTSPQNISQQELASLQMSHFVPYGPFIKLHYNADLPIHKKKKANFIKNFLFNIKIQMMRNMNFYVREASALHCAFITKVAMHMLTILTIPKVRPSCRCSSRPQ